MANKRHVIVIPLGAGMMLVESNSRGNVFHAVDVLDRHCSCEDEHFRKRECRHLGFATALVAAAKKKG